jgi:Skp family chaperone for outer membrane proteins
VEAIKAIEEAMAKKQNEFNDPSLAEKKRKEIAASAQELAATRSVLIKEGDEFLKKQRRSLNQKMVGMINDIRNKVETAVSEHAATLDVNLVFDESGLTSSRTPFLIYSRNTVDLTDAVLKKLNKDAPSPVTLETPGGAKPKAEAPK